jgi:FMN-dependent oxidoreductase (nitrilotriacetate monooxygenase family)
MKPFHLAWFGNAGPTGWRKPSGQLFDWRRADIYLEIARLCERAKFDMVLFADSLAVPAVLGGSRDWSVAHGHHVTQDPLPTIAMMGAVTNNLGLGCTLSSTFYPPFLLARMLATLDQLTNGRAAWNLVTTASKDAAQNFGLDDILEHDLRYDRADEYVALCRALWDSWEPDAVVMDRDRNIFADPAKVRAVDFEGEHFRSKGPSTVTSSPQRHPIISVAGTSVRGQKFAVQHGDMAISHKNSIDDMRNYVRTTREQLEAAGRDPKSVKIFFSIKPVMGDTEAEAREQWEKNLASADIDAGMATLATFLGIDLLQFDIDKPLPRDLHVPGMRGTFQRYLSMPEGTTLRDWARVEGLYETYEICGTPDHVADVLAHTAEYTDCDGFHFRPSQGITDIAYLLDVATKLIPVLQQRGLFRREYKGLTLRDHLFEY